MPDIAPSIEFMESHRPNLLAGHYTLTIQQTVEGKESFNSFKESIPAQSYTFDVAGPQFALSPQDIDAVFPPPGSLGDHSNVLPHIAFVRSTLPWERSAEAGTSGKPIITKDWRQAPAPWLALLLFTEAELKPGTNGELPLVQVPDPVALADLNSAVAFFPPLVDSAGTLLSPKQRRPPKGKPAMPEIVVSGKLDGTTRVPVVDVERNLLKQLLPDSMEQRLLSHVRHSLPGDGDAAERAFVIGNRMPKAGEISTVHLVSLEHRYNDEGFIFPYDARIPYVRLVSLHQWRFACESHQHTFEGLLLHLNELFTLQTSVLAGLPAAEGEVADAPSLLRGAFAGAGYPVSPFARVKRDSTRPGYEHWTVLDPDPVQGNYQYGLRHPLEPYSAQKMDDVHVSLVSPSSLRLPRVAHQATELHLSAGFALVPHQLRDGSQSYSWYRGPLVPCEIRSGGTEASEAGRPLAAAYPAKAADALLGLDVATGLLHVRHAAAWELGRSLCVANLRVSTALFQWRREHRRHTRLNAMRDAGRLDHLPIWATHLPIETPDPPQVVMDWFASLRQLEPVPFRYLVPDEKMLPPESIRFFQVDPNWLHSLVDGALGIGRLLDRDFEHERQLQIDYASDFFPGTVVTGILLRSAVVSGWPSLRVVASAHASPEKPLDDVRIDRLAPDVLLCLFAGRLGQIVLSLPPETVHFGILNDENDAPKLPPGTQLTNDRILRLKGLPADGLHPGTFALHLVAGVPQVTFGA